LLETVTYGEDLCLISGDGDFASHLNESSLSPYLAQEWQQRNNSVCTLYPSLGDFLRDKFPKFRLADEDSKLAAIAKLEDSKNFATTHNAIATLATVPGFSRPELLRLINAYQINDQVEWILADHDVKQFAHRLVEMAYKKDMIDECYRSKTC
jgi:hypothetical protein